MTCMSNAKMKTCAIDLLVDKLDRQVIKYKEKLVDHHPVNGAVKHQATE